MPDIFGLIKEDLQNLPANIRYFFYGGVFLILIAWLGDHWSDQKQYQLPLFQSNENAFQLGYGIIIVFFVLLFFKQVWIFRKQLWIQGRIWTLRRRYPVDKLDSKQADGFYLVNFREQWIDLFDKKNKQRFHVRTAQSYNDLWPLGEWTNSTISKDAPVATELTLRNGDIIKLEHYPISPIGIYTQD
jgi:hypothetical protein